MLRSEMLRWGHNDICTLHPQTVIHQSDAPKSVSRRGHCPAQQSSSRTEKILVLPPACVYKNKIGLTTLWDQFSTNEFSTRFKTVASYLAHMEYGMFGKHPITSLESHDEGLRFIQHRVSQAVWNYIYIYIYIYVYMYGCMDVCMGMCT